MQKQDGSFLEGCQKNGSASECFTLRNAYCEDWPLLKVVASAPTPLFKCHFTNVSGLSTKAVPSNEKPYWFAGTNQ